LCLLVLPFPLASAGKAEWVRVSKQGAGTTETLSYVLHRHRVVLLDTDRSAAAGCPAEIAECLAADVLVLFMGNARAEVSVRVGGGWGGGNSAA
jgi:hypothetical protein